MSRRAIKFMFAPGDQIVSGVNFLANAILLSGAKPTEAGYNTNRTLQPVGQPLSIGFSNWVGHRVAGKRASHVPSCARRPGLPIDRFSVRGRPHLRRYPLLILTLVFGLHLALLAAYGHVRADRMVIRGIDSVGYYAYFQSLYFDHDLDFTDEFEEIGEGRVPYFITETGRPSNFFSIGPAIALSPFLLAADAVAHLTGQPTDGSSSPYHVAAFLGLTFYAWLALILMALWLGMHFGKGPGAWAAMLAWGGTTFLYYSAPIAFMPHAIGTAASALILLSCDRKGSDRLPGACLMGVALGLGMLARWQNALLVFYPLVQSVLRWRRSEDSRSAFVGEIKFWSVFTLSSLLAFSPQIAAWYVIYGKLVLVPMGEGFLRYFQPRILQLLTSMERGLFTWTPITLLAVLGLAAVRAPLASRAAALGACFLAQLYLNSIVMDWDASWGFGMRRFTEMTPIMAFGIGAWLTRWDAREWRRAVIAIGMLFFVWNELFIYQYIHHLISWDAPLTWHEYAGDKFHLSRSLLRRRWHNQARLELMSGDLGESLASIEQAKQFDRQHDDIYLIEAVVYESMGDFERAERTLLKAQSIRPGNPHLPFLFRRVREKLEAGEANPSIAPALPPGDP